MTDRSVEVEITELRELLLSTRNHSRRDFLLALRDSAAGLALFGAMFPYMSKAADAAMQPVTIFSYGGIYKKAMYEAFCNPFTKKTGIPIQYQEPYSFAKLRAMHEAKVSFADLDAIAALPRGPEQAVEIWLASRLVCDPDDAREKTYLTTLAAKLKLPSDLLTQLEEEVATTSAPVAVG